MSWANATEENSGGHTLRIHSWTVLRKPTWRDGAMTRHYENDDPAGDPRTDSGPESWPLLERLATAGLRPTELAELPPSRGARVTALARRARREPPAALSLLGLLGPELTAFRRRLVALGTDPDEAEELVLSVAWEVVSGRRLRRRPRSAGSLCEAIWRAVRQEAGGRRLQVRTVPLRDCPDVSGYEADPLERWPGLLGAAVAAGVLTPRQVVIVAQSRMEERPLTEVARRLGRPYDAVRMERRRAEQALRAFALTYDWSDS